MITRIDNGSYSIHLTNNNTKILTLNFQAYAWISTENTGDILLYLTKSEKAMNINSSGLFRLYSVNDEEGFADMIHLELCNEQGKWRGYVLPTGLPSKADIKNKIISTHELISKSLS
jgi:hypothetical protein